jgi:hypothetical protein
MKQARTYELAAIAAGRKTVEQIRAANAARKRRSRGATGLLYQESHRRGLCQLCGRETALNYDHDHNTGAFRGWLCVTCNSGLGKLGDDVAGLKRAIKYLERGQ